VQSRERGAAVSKLTIGNGVQSRERGAAVSKLTRGGVEGLRYSDFNNTVEVRVTSNSF
jgi:hypothetical protein